MDSFISITKALYLVWVFQHFEIHYPNYRKPAVKQQVRLPQVIQTLQMYRILQID